MRTSIADEPFQTRYADVWFYASPRQKSNTGTNLPGFCCMKDINRVASWPWKAGWGDPFPACRSRRLLAWCRPSRNVPGKMLLHFS